MDKELKKAEWEKLLRAFLTQHYCKLMFQSMYRYSCSLDLASGKKFKQVPFSTIKQDTASFILNQYRPSGVILQDPRNMHLEDIWKVLKHCYVRQAESGPESAFRLAIYIGPRRKQLPATYADTQNNNGHANNGPAEPASSRRKKDKGKQREDPLNGLLQIDQSVEPPTEIDKEFGDQQNPDQDDIEVPEAIFRELTATRRSPEPPNTDQSTVSQPEVTDSVSNQIEPALLEGAPTRPSTPTNNVVSLVNNSVNKTPTMRLGKRPQANLSPPKVHQTRIHKKKKLTDDDLASIEAENSMLLPRTRRRSKPTRRK